MHIVMDLVVNQDKHDRQCFNSLELYFRVLGLLDNDLAIGRTMILFSGQDFSKWFKTILYFTFKLFCNKSSAAF